MGFALSDPDGDWIPCRVAWQEQRPLVDWCYLGEAHFSEPLFQDTITRALSRPFSAAFQRRTPIEALEQTAWPDPAGLIFEMSRCGSTLVSQMLKAIPGVTVFSEPPPVDSIVRAPEFGIDVKEEQHAVWLRSIARALGWGGARGHRAYILKLDCWHTVDLPLFRRAFPSTPWIFLYRDPLEVLASHASRPTEWTVAGYLKAARFGFDAAAVAPAALAEYRARLLAGMLRGAVKYCDEFEGYLVNYAQLPDWGWTTLPSVFRLDASAQEIAAMRETATQDSKGSPFAFEPDAELKSAKATPELHALSQAHLYPLYRQLEEQRMRRAPEAAPR